MSAKHIHKNSKTNKISENKVKKLSDSLIKQMLENEASSRYAMGLIRGESATGGITAEVIAASRKKARKLLDELMMA